MDQSTQERANVSAVCRHLALVAIDGPSDEVVGTLAPEFRLHIDASQTDCSGYLALIEANRAAHAALTSGSCEARPPLDLLSAHGVRDFVTARLEPRCLGYFRLQGAKISEIWLMPDWQAWLDRIH